MFRVSEKMRIGQLANLAGVTPRTIRYYESLGLLGPSEREGSGFRYYTQTALIRLQKINDLKAIGFSLEEIAKVIPLCFEESVQQLGLHQVMEILKRRLQEADEKLVVLSHLRADLQASLDRIQQALEASAETGTEQNETYPKETTGMIVE